MFGQWHGVRAGETPGPRSFHKFCDCRAGAAFSMPGKPVFDRGALSTVPGGAFPAPRRREIASTGRKIESRGFFTDRNPVRCASGSAPDSPAACLSLHKD
jgi:hypothetical protein